MPVHARSTDGEVFDFGTHANDFLVRREESLATETFLVRVPGGGAVPEHVHRWRRDHRTRRTNPRLGTPASLTWRCGIAG
ncbi:MAG: hypothetical protein JO309_01190 [Pseudonocardiales bacterium]|nr:hypothetical protein [Pseudonocardiales bacterium]MBV9728029.1 hypothetical protein [Pseudonocardiales bacterium]